MARRGKRRRLAANIYEDASGIAAVVRVGGKSTELRFPRGTAMAVIRHDMQAKAVELEELKGEVERGTLAAVCQTYLETVRAEDRPEREQLLQPWVDAFGPRAWWSLTKADLQSETKRWRAAGLAASTCNKRISALRVAWRSQAPDRGLIHGVERLERYSEPPPITRGGPLPLLQEAIDSMPDTYINQQRQRVANKSKLRLTFLLWSGQPPARLQLIRPEHCRLQQTPPEVYVQPRRKGTGSADAWLPLLPAAAQALQGLIDCGGLEPFNARSLALKWERARDNTAARLEAEGRVADAATLRACRMYDARHSFGAELAEKTNDVYAVAEYLGHSNLQTTRRYLRRAAKARMTAGIAALSDALGARNGGE